jgi:hypothetical protein
MNNKLVKVYIVGNILVEEDSQPFKIIDFLKKELPAVSFIEYDPTEDLPLDSDLWFIDTVQGLKEPKLFTDIDVFLMQKPYSMHDADFGFQLKLAKKLHPDQQIHVLGIPYVEITKEVDMSITAKKVVELLKSV